MPVEPASRGAEPPDTIRILLADDQPLFRRAIATLIEEQPELTVVGEAENGLRAVEMAHRLQPDLVVMDVQMPVMNGVEAVRLIRDQLPAIKVVMLTVSDADDHLFDAIRFGAHGYLLKDLRPDQLYDLLRAVMRNETPLSPAIAGRLLAEFRATPRGDPRRVDTGDASRAGSLRTSPPDEPAGPGLTRRELEIVQLVAEGLSNKEIGTRLSITEGTVKNHVHNALEKLQFENRIQAAAYVVRQGLAPPAGYDAAVAGRATRVLPGGRTMSIDRAPAPQACAGPGIVAARASAHDAPAGQRVGEPNRPDPRERWSASHPPDLRRHPLLAPVAR